MEELVNDAILEGYPVVTEILPIEEAKEGRRGHVR